MHDENLDHLIPRKKEIHGVSGWASVQLRYIRDELKPFVERGMPVKHIMRLLAPLDITQRRETVRQFLLDEFPEHYARYYAKSETAKRIRGQVSEQKPIPKTVQQKTPTQSTPSALTDKAEPPKSAVKPAQGTKRLSVEGMLNSASEFTSGKHFDKQGESE
ncbi:hypothetical protein [Vreelandella alkaliphila]|uniref:Uncharacterized protein n=1 Tax=Vreelandella alkaliphila TaxID=272774 RepID=A0AAJ2S463_9GAMM|nr:hypothetical protein [Halomonas alkaliphila]MDX5979569.1 hypothetical protein [Halomonas alkaliphila]